MAPGNFKCSKCERTFSMPAHLARHMNTIHRAKAGAKAPKKMTRAKSGPGRPKGTGVGHRGGAVKRMAGAGTPLTGEAARLVHDMRAHHAALLAQRSAMDAQIDCIGRAIEAMGSAAPARPGPKKMAKRGRPAGRGMRAGSLKDFIIRVLQQHGKPMSPREIGSKVVSAGFKTKARDLTKAVSNTLPQVPRVKKVGFGLYQVVGAAS